LSVDEIVILKEKHIGSKILRVFNIKSVILIAFSLIKKIGIGHLKLRYWHMNRMEKWPKQCMHMWINEQQQQQQKIYIYIYILWMRCNKLSERVLFRENQAKWLKCAQAFSCAKF
jgi:hypothetical protein